VSIILSLAIFIGFALWVQHSMKKSSDILTQHFQSLEEAVKEEEWDKANMQLESIMKAWNSTKTKWQMLIDHQEVDNIDSTLARVIQYVKLKVKEDSLAEIAALKLYVTHIPSTESLKLENVF